MHVAGVYDGATMKIYVNGVEVASQSKSGSITHTNSTFYVGYDPDSGAGTNGLIANARVWLEARTPTQLKDNMNKTLTGSENNLLLCYPLAGDLVDLTGSHNLSFLSGGFALGKASNDIAAGGFAMLSGGEYSTDIVSYWQGLSFDGVNDYAEADTVSNGESVSMAMMFRVDSLTGAFQFIAGQGVLSGGTEDKGFGFFLKDDRSLVFQCRDGVSASISAETPAGFIELGRWYAVAGVRNSATQETILIINGRQIDSSTGAIPTIVTPTSELFSVGRRYPNSDFYANMKLANISVWDSALSLSTIKDYPKTFFLGNEAGLLAYWPMVESKGTVAYNHAANNDLSVSGAVFTENVGAKPL